ncbi:MAG: hypothetical protein JWM76_693 [Pseudonocardiales bacterium]|nr:hypothetical protein [Pseudonocardiales bacterium]
MLLCYWTSNANNPLIYRRDRMVWENLSEVSLAFFLMVPDTHYAACNLDGRPVVIFWGYPSINMPHI